MKKQPVILFFIAGTAATAAEHSEAFKYGQNVRFRNASFIKEGEALEACDGVAGKVPKAYAGVATAEEAMQRWLAEVDAEMKERADKAEAVEEKSTLAALSEEVAAKAATEASKPATPPAAEKAATKQAKIEAAPAPAGWTANK